MKPLFLPPLMHKRVHQFIAKESDWGFTSFMSLQDLYDPSKGFLVNNTMIFEAEFNVRDKFGFQTTAQYDM
ncbi:hypothetical protein CLOM_g16040 [Closterium sp. NIES-68]|nr:hypothetical protein CLOM_g16040 [Closterium sp. NIES-68]GJP85698.1 hypothetical protein CLOP_g15808 [Closterium sp. NIES-67]